MRLPNSYTEVQYIESTGTQWINTGFKPNQNTRVKMDCNVIGFNSSDAFLFGARIASGNTAFCMAADDENTRWFALYGNNVQNPTGACKGKHSIDFNQNVLTLDEKNFTFEKTTFQSSYNLLLFATITNGNVDSQRGKMAVYSCQLYDNGSLIRNFIPCINPDGETGLYDTVNSKFYGNAGTCVFFAGPPRVTLPSAYTQLEYILSSATQLIDTEIKPGNTTKVEIDFEPTTLTSNHLMILGARNTSSGGNQFVIGWAGHKSPAVWRSDYGSSQVSFTTTITGATRHYAVKDGASCKIDTETVSNTVATFTSAYTLYLFGGNQAGTAVSQITAKLYRCKIYISDQLVRDFIPCMNAAGTIGLYDLANNKFYANAGTGVFTAGPEVIWPSNDAIYVKVNGIWKRIDGITIS